MTTNDQTVTDSSQATDATSPLPTDASVSPQKDTQRITTKDGVAATETDEEKAVRLHNEAKMWEGRAKKAKEKVEEQSKPLTEADVDWRIDHKSRIALVKDTYEKELQDLEGLGVKLTLAARTKALENAEAKALPRHSDSSNSSLPTPSINRGGVVMPHLTEHDIAFGVKAETKQEYRDYVENR